MTEEADLQAKIAAISGKINQHKQQQPLTPNSQHHQAQHHASYSTRGYHRWSPYGRSGRGGYVQPHMNRTLVLGGTPKTAATDPDSATSSTTSLTDSGIVTPSFVTTRAPGRTQLMNKDTYDREQKQKLGQLERSRTARRQKVNREERSRLIQHTSNQGSREMVVEGIRFQLRDDGSKLIRISGKQVVVPKDSSIVGELSKTDVASVSKETPRQVKIADVNFFRTKTGNLVRANAVKDLNRLQRLKQRPQCEHFTKHGTHLPFVPDLNVLRYGARTIPTSWPVSCVHH